MNTITESGDEDEDVALSDDNDSSVREHTLDERLAGAEDKLEAEWQRAAQQQSRAVAVSRSIVFVALVAAVAIVVLEVGRYIRNDQREDFEHSFDANAYKIIEAFHASIQRRLEAGTSKHERVFCLFPLCWACSHGGAIISS